MASKPVKELHQEHLAARSPKWHDFSALAAGKRKRTEPTFGCRVDGQALFYPGKEHSIYGETETGKDMLLALTVMDCLDTETGDDRLRVAWVDFEEGDEIDNGSRLLNAGLDPALLNDREWFRYATPATEEEANANLRDVLAWRPDVVIWNGVMAAYGLYGWPVKEGDSATAYRARLIRPCLDKGIATISTDHVPKDPAAQGRYAYGGVMKLNMVNGAAYLLRTVSPIGRGWEGASKLILTKDRPGSVKPGCTRLNGKNTDPALRYAGMLTVKSSGDEPGELALSVVPPMPDDGLAAEEGDKPEVPGWLLEKVSRRFEEAAEAGRSKTSVRQAWDGKGAKQVPAAIEILERGYLAPGGKSTSGRKLVSVRPYRDGEKITLSGTGSA